MAGKHIQRRKASSTSTSAAPSLIVLQLWLSPEGKSQSSRVRLHSAMFVCKLGMPGMLVTAEPIWPSTLRFMHDIIQAQRRPYQTLHQVSCSSASSEMASAHENPDVEVEEEFDPLSDPEEQRVLVAALDSFRQYRKAAHYNITHLRRQSFYSLPSAHLDILSEPPFSLQNTFRAVDDAIDANADIAESILEFCLPAFGIDSDDTSWHGKATPTDMDKARSTIRQIYRDWSNEGSIERDPSHRLIFSALASHLNPEDQPSQRHRSRILVPGAGLGRLVLDLCALGYSVQGNEISYHQILASNYLLNGTRETGQHKLYPWALTFSNHLTRANQLQSVSVPDINPMTYLEEGGDEKVQSEVHFSERLSMASGDFCALYKQGEYENHFDAMVSHFFIDTAPNVISYIETVKHCLRPGGIWINLGPLLWHFESSPTPAEREKERHEGIDGRKSQKKNADEGIGEPGSFELTNEEVLALLRHLRFEILEQSEAPMGHTGYVQDAQSMLQNMYRPALWVAKKTNV